MGPKGPNPYSMAAVLLRAFIPLEPKAGFEPLRLC